MKIIRIILILLGYLLILTQGFFTVYIIVKGYSGHWYDAIFAPVVVMLIGGLFLFSASRIRKSIRRKKGLELIKSLGTEPN